MHAQMIARRRNSSLAGYVVDAPQADPNVLEFLFKEPANIHIGSTDYNAVLVFAEEQENTMEICSLLSHFLTRVSPSHPPPKSFLSFLLDRPFLSTP